MRPAILCDALSRLVDTRNKREELNAKAAAHVVALAWPLLMGSTCQTNSQLTGSYGQLASAVGWDGAGKPFAAREDQMMPFSTNYAREAFRVSK